MITKELGSRQAILWTNVFKWVIDLVSSLRNVLELGNINDVHADLQEITSWE
jgi:hypothetical protein